MSDNGIDIRPETGRTIALGREAAGLLDGEGALGIALDLAHRQFVDRWIDSIDPRERDRLWAQVHALTEVERHLRVIQSEGEYAEDAREREGLPLP